MPAEKAPRRVRRHLMQPVRDYVSALTAEIADEDVSLKRPCRSCSQPFTLSVDEQAHFLAGVRCEPRCPACLSRRRMR